ncbi:MAG: polyphosphate kinase 2 family protein [Anaerolineae bacterium]
MLEKVDLGRKMTAAEWKAARPLLQQRLYDFERAAYDVGMPAVILFEGWDAAGKGTSIATLTQRLDPRGFKVWPIRAARPDEQNRPWLWRFWLKLPNRGQLAIFDRSWYGRVLVERVEELTPDAEWRKAYRDITDFERAIADDGCLVIKFLLHISKKEQDRRLRRLEKDPLTAWRVAPEDWEHHRKYGSYLQAYEEMLERTESEWGPWTIVEATDRRYTSWKVLNTVVESLAAGLRARGVDPEALAPEAMAATAPEAAGPPPITAAAAEPMQAGEEG